MAVFEKHLQIGEHAFANALDREKFFRLLNQVGYLLRKCFDGFGGVAIGAHAKRVLTVDLEQIGGFVENSGYGLVVHSKASSRIKETVVFGRLVWLCSGDLYHREHRGPQGRSTGERLPQVSGLAKWRGRLREDTTSRASKA